MVLSRISKNGTLSVKDLDGLTIITFDNIRSFFRRDTLFYVVQSHSKHLKFVCNYFQIRDRLVSGWNKVSMYQCGILITFNVKSDGESDEEWSEWYESAKCMIRETIIRKELYGEKITQIV